MQAPEYSLGMGEWTAGRAWGALLSDAANAASRVALVASILRLVFVFVLSRVGGRILERMLVGPVVIAFLLVCSAVAVLAGILLPLRC